MRKAIAVAAISAAALGVAGCGSNADTVSDNISKEAEKFNVQRKIVGINGITDKPIFLVEGRCSIEREALGLVVTCKHGPSDFRKHYVGISDNVTYVVTQVEGISVSEYRTKIILRPTSIVPDLDLMVG